MRSISKADLYFILPINMLVDLKSKIDDDWFVRKLISVQNDEFSESLCSSTFRSRLYCGTLNYMESEFPFSIYCSNFEDYNSSLVYICVNIDKKISIECFSNFINGKNILYKAYSQNIRIFDLLNKIGIDNDEIEEVFLFCQLVDVYHKFPKTYEEGLEYIENHKRIFHQILLRSDTCSDHLRPDNHASNFESISNFYGTIDMCSPITLLQIYQFPIKSICENNYIYDLPHRACWWLTITDIIFIQKSVLCDTLKNINIIQNKEKKKTVKSMTQIEKVIIKMQGYWYFEDFTHEITKKVVNKVKERVGVTSMLDSVLTRVESLENTVLREINEEQNEYNYYLNVILLVVAIIQIVPIIHQINSSIHLNINQISLDQVFIWIQSILISLSFPTLIYIIGGVKKRVSANSIMLLKDSQQRRKK